MQCPGQGEVVRNAWLCEHPLDERRGRHGRRRREPAELGDRRARDGDTEEAESAYHRGREYAKGNGRSELEEGAEADFPRFSSEVRDDLFGRLERRREM